MISVENLVVRFGQEGPDVIKNISFTVERGRSFGLVGESGCGKSTILRALAGLVQPVAGMMLIDDLAVDRKRPRHLMRTVQMVFQDPYGSLHPRKTVRTQLLEPLRNQRMSRSEDIVEDTLVSVGLSTDLLHRYPHELSGGQRQRVSIARALILEPDVLLLDEPTSALDVSVQAEILNLLGDLRKQRGLTYLLVSHDLAVISHMCDIVAVVQSGRIIEIVNVEELRAGRFEHPYSRQLLVASQAYR